MDWKIKNNKSDTLTKMFVKKTDVCHYWLVNATETTLFRNSPSSWHHKENRYTGNG